jgi:hypothetical protein
MEPVPHYEISYPYEDRGVALIIAGLVLTTCGGIGMFVKGLKEERVC